MRATGRIALATFAAFLGVGICRAWPADGPVPEKSGRSGTNNRLGMTTAVACKRVDGFDRYVPLPAASLTSDDKLKVYFQPTGFQVEPSGKKYRARLSEDARVRRKGEKAVLSREDKLLEYEAELESPYHQIYLVNNIGLKGLAPGDYEFEIILHDALDEGSTATQTLSFTIIPTPKADPAAKTAGPDETEVSPVPAEEPKAKKASKARKSRSPR